MENEKENTVSIWNVVETSIGRNAKVYRLADTLNIKVAETVGCLVLFWGSVLEQREDGDISSWTGTEIERYAGWGGEKGAFAKALYKKENPFIDVVKGIHLVHGWLDFSGRYLIKRYGTANREKLIEIWAKHGRSYGQSQEEEPKKPKRIKSEKKFADDSLEIKISKYLFGFIKKNNQKAKLPDYQKWAVHVDGLLRLDKVSKEDIASVIKWIQVYKGSNGFTWKVNILSTENLRKHFPKMWLQMNEDQKKSKSEKPKTYKCDCGMTLPTSQKYTHENGECPIHKPATPEKVKEIIANAKQEESPEEIRKEIDKQFPKKDETAHKI